MAETSMSIAQALAFDGSLRDASLLSVERVTEAFAEHRDECAQQLSAAVADLEHLQGLFEDAMGSMAQAFMRIASELDLHANPAAAEWIKGLQYQDICAQIAAHLRLRLTHTAALVEGLNLPFAALLAEAGDMPEEAQRAYAGVLEMDVSLAEMRALAQARPVRWQPQGSVEVDLF